MTPYIFHIYSYRLHLLFIHIIHTHIHMLEVSMYIVTLLIVIASLTLVECYSAKSEIRLGYGLLYEHRGQLLHGLNKCHLLVGVEMSKFTFTA